ncbi:hypothetical protein AALO_G00121530 [Alosa alosa]|uniref:Uncharacterized protein n=1 Tax=Alosa alosa TaxID=278164 RepID=A0AAV6GRU0_9TELE|nr:hypothetical protein AALO_G00121530 [Alosa alosa]
MWSADGSELGQVAARMETSPPMGTTSISVSQQQPPKKFAPVVAPKPKFNPYKPPGEGAEGDYPPPPPPVADASGLPSPSSYPPPPPMDGSPLGFQCGGVVSGKTDPYWHACAMSSGMRRDICSAGKLSLSAFPSAVLTLPLHRPQPDFPPTHTCCPLYIPPQ